jgi:hypothetical protein
LSGFGDIRFVYATPDTEEKRVTRGNGGCWHGCSAWFAVRAWAAVWQWAAVENRQDRQVGRGGVAAEKQSSAQEGRFRGLQVRQGRLPAWGSSG